MARASRAEAAAPVRAMTDGFSSGSRKPLRISARLRYPNSVARNDQGRRGAGRGDGEEESTGDVPIARAAIANRRTTPSWCQG